MMLTKKLTVIHANPLEYDTLTLRFTESMTRINIVNPMCFSKKITKTNLKQQQQANNHPQKQVLQTITSRLLRGAN
jgi:hypothetical protein